MGPMDGLQIARWESCTQERWLWTVPRALQWLLPQWSISRRCVRSYHGGKRVDFPLCPVDSHAGLFRQGDFTGGHWEVPRAVQRLRVNLRSPVPRPGVRARLRSDAKLRPVCLGFHIRGYTDSDDEANIDPYGDADIDSDGVSYEDADIDSDFARRLVGASVIGVLRSVDTTSELDRSSDARREENLSCPFFSCLCGSYVCVSLADGR